MRRLHKAEGEIPDSKTCWAHVGPTLSQQDPRWANVGPKKLLSRMRKHGIGTWMVPSHYLKQCWNVVNCTSENKLQWILIKIYTFSLKEMHLKMSSGNGGHFVSASVGWGSAGHYKAIAILPYFPDKEYYYKVQTLKNLCITDCRNKCYDCCCNSVNSLHCEKLPTAKTLGSNSIRHQLKISNYIDV